jgi:hypothetical protein
MAIQTDVAKAAEATARKAAKQIIAPAATIDAIDVYTMCKDDVGGARAIACYVALSYLIVVDRLNAAERQVVALNKENDKLREIAIERTRR